MSIEHGVELGRSKSPGGIVTDLFRLVGIKETWADCTLSRSQSRIASLGALKLPPSCGQPNPTPVVLVHLVIN